jgi:hypothetical protein
MTQTNKLTQQIHSSPIGKPMLFGAGIGLIVISYFLIGNGEPNPAWGKLWMIRPLIVVPAAGATGGVFYYFMDHLRYQGGWKKILANILSLIIFIIGLWLGIVLGLAGTMWN